MKFVRVPVIRTDKDRDFVSRRLNTMLSPSSKALKKDVDELRVMAALIHHHTSSKCEGMKFPDPVSAIKFYMEQLGMAPSDLMPFLGSQGAVSRILNRKRNLTIKMIRRLHNHLQIPAEALIQPVRRWEKKRTT